MKRSIALLTSIFFLSLSSCVIHNPLPEDCEVIDVNISKIQEGSTFDIVFLDDHSEVYYINRGLQQGLNLESLNAKVLNKTVTLHLPKLIYGTSNHIAQLTHGDEIIYSEF